ncbi:MAG: MbnP family protein [Chthoniobacterales bacterium]|jgi:cytochrome c peroxidase
MKLLRWIAPAAALASPLCAANLEITIEPVFNGEPLRLDSLSYDTAARETLSVTRLSYLLSGFALEGDDGRWTEIPETIAWIDATSRRNSVLLENIPPGKFRALRFHIGPDPKANAADVTRFPATHPLNPNLNGLHWTWQTGYIFMAIEGHYRAGNSASKGYAHHLARDPNRTRITLPAPLDLTHDAGALLHLDIATLLNAPRPLSFEKDGSATHSRDGDPIAAVLVANLPGAFRVNRIVSSAPVVGNLPPVTPIDLPEKFTPYRFTMSRTFPIPDLPRDNPLIEERVALGEKLFHDKALSRDGSISCATCHQADAAFTDRLATSKGIDGRTGERNSMPLFNLAWKREFFWDGRAASLRQQVLMPIADHREMDESIDRVAEKLTASPEYTTLFHAAYRSPGITAEKISLALEQFLLTLSARDSRFDRAMAGKASLTDQEKRGFELFMTEYEPRTGQYGADCFHCHGGALFTDHQFHNNGLSSDDRGRAIFTGSAADEHKFSTPSLRNVALTAPYMHDGRFATLEEVVEHYSSGVRRGETLDPNLAKHPANGLNLSTEDKAALVAFLKTLTETK